ncbi:MAG: 2Fe-2S iron-sulfur cluster-binding protein [Burkholderiales bacterium]
MKIDLNARNRAHHFDAAEGEKILYAGLCHGVDLPYECCSGTCGTCKARLIAGEISDPWPEAPGRKFLKGQDEFLLCQCTAKTDILIEVASFVQPMEVNTCVPASIIGRINVAKLLTSDVMFLQIGVSRPLEFDAGQFVMIQAPGVKGFRAWSIANYQRPAETLDFIVKKKPGGCISEWLFNNECTGVEVKLFGPLGHATFYPGLAKDILCIAGGSGVAGMMSILSCAAQEGYFARYSTDVFFGVRAMKDTFFLEEFSQWRAQFGNKLNATIALSEEDVPASALTSYPYLAFKKGLVHEVARDEMQGHYQNIRAYLAGPPPLVDASIRMLLQAKVTTDNIRYDKFS